MLPQLCSWVPVREIAATGMLGFRSLALGNGVVMRFIRPEGWSDGERLLELELLRVNYLQAAVFLACVQ